MRRSLAIGDLAELVVLDTRIPGRDLQYGDDGAKALDDPTRSLLDADQRAWALERIGDQSRRWCLLASQVPVAELELPIPLGRVVDEAMPAGYRVIDGEAICTDVWEGYPVERTALIDAIGQRGTGAVVVSGDVHSSWASLLCDAGDHAVAADLVAPAVSATEMGQRLPRGWRKLAEKIGDDVPHQVWHDLERHGYLRVDIRPHVVRGDWFAIESDQHGEQPERLASWAIDWSQPGRLRREVPSSALGAIDDARRPGVPVDALPAPAAPPPRSRAKRGALLIASLVVFALVAVVAGRLRRRSR
jgi:alkaline phosphatase D